MAIGGSSEHGNTVESLSNEYWKFEPSFPFLSRLQYFSTVTLNEILYLFGKFFFFKIFRNINYSGGQYSLTMAVKYDGNGWTQIGQLLQGRYQHRSVVNGNAIMHVGGSGTL